MRNLLEYLVSMLSDINLIISYKIILAGFANIILGKMEWKWQLKRLFLIKIAIQGVYINA